MGLVFYGWLFMLFDFYNNGVGVFVKGKGNVGNYIWEVGFLFYFEVYICFFLFLFNEVLNSKVLFKY